MGERPITSLGRTNAPGILSLGGLAPWALEPAELSFVGPGLGRPGWVARPGTARVQPLSATRPSEGRRYRPGTRRQALSLPPGSTGLHGPLRRLGRDGVCLSALDVGALHRRRLFHVGVKKETKLNKLPVRPPPPLHCCLASSDFLSPLVLLVAQSFPGLHQHSGHSPSKATGCKQQNGRPRLFFSRCTPRPSACGITTYLPTSCLALTRAPSSSA